MGWVLGRVGARFRTSAARKGLGVAGVGFRLSTTGGALESSSSGWDPSELLGAQGGRGNAGQVSVSPPHM